MRDNLFMDQMEENVKFNLIFPYHIHHDKLLGNEYYNPEHPDSYHCHKFEDVLHAAYMEAKAFYLTDEDKKYYSEQEIEFINKVIEDESKKIDAGYEIITLDLEEETIAMIEAYRTQKGMTFEEAVIDILKKAIENPEVLKEATKEATETENHE